MKKPFFTRDVIDLISAYYLFQSIGAGSFGTVYRGMWQEKSVALKVYHQASNQVSVFHFLLLIFIIIEMAVFEPPFM